jgi:predicted GIY-YIG superfamily endonuclease
MYYVYILRCADDSFYVGYARDPSERAAAHNSGQGAAYTFKRLPVELIYSETHATRLDAIRRERQLKRWTRKKKEALIQGDLARLRALSKRRT